MTIKEELHEINEEITKLRARRRGLEDKERSDFYPRVSKRCNINKK